MKAIQLTAQHQLSATDFKQCNENTSTMAHAREQLTAQEFQEWNRPNTNQSLIKRMWDNTREWKRQQQQ